MRFGYFCDAKGCGSKKTLLALERARADIARRRQRWRSWQANLDPRRLVFIDETWIKTNMAPLRGWGPKARGCASAIAWIFVFRLPRERPIACLCSPFLPPRPSGAP